MDLNRISGRITGFTGSVRLCVQIGFFFFQFSYNFDLSGGRSCCWRRDHRAMDLAELWAIFGPGFSGAVFGTGWWFWVDAVVCSSTQVPFLHYLPGIFASLGALMFNCVRKEDIDYSPYDEGEWRLKLWLFIAYVVAFVSLAASVGLLIQDSVVKTGPSTWTGVAGVFQCVFVLISGLMYWTSHSE
ncbi:hypothetical protein CARUB_v10010396mg [Capsella rubella]|uniref:Transmembrane protein 50A n=2 Tax=Capsella rubella TaxID=81985 RepID=R0GS25_9BRAS|nr:hypothetical protein CARUB_v10010396mg [Capsella rubella]